MTALAEPRTRRLLALLLLAGWAGSLALPAITISNGQPEPVTLHGYAVLAWGWIHLVIPQFGWLANIALAPVLIMLIRERPGPFGLRLTAALLLIPTLHTLDLLLRPDYYTFFGAHPGYWLWLAVNLAAASSAIFLSLPGSAKGPA